MIKFKNTLYQKLVRPFATEVFLYKSNKEQSILIRNLKIEIDHSLENYTYNLKGEIDDLGKFKLNRRMGLMRINEHSNLDPVHLQGQIQKNGNASEVHLEIKPSIVLTFFTFLFPFVILFNMLSNYQNRGIGETILTCFVVLGFLTFFSINNNITKKYYRSEFEKATGLTHKKTPDHLTWKL